MRAGDREKRELEFFNTYNPKFKPKRLPNENLRFGWDGHVHSACNTANFSDWLIFQNQGCSLVAMLMSISQSL